ncbi:hypothetical protein [Streptomyces sp. NBC_01262]|uniref:hypothetical protein n=1 Tax=Streptomyces sp. NBC_01262 TaxID=2903803 RepID=UPI002E343A78|nr:hypothetical protein [Streptomyces sp. NBC_01262]
MIPRSEADQLRAALADTAYAITPSPVPLTAIRRTGSQRRARRRAAGLTVCCALLLAPLAVAVGGERVLQSGPAAVRRAPAVRVVAPGEKVQAGSGVEVWLTKQGLYSSAWEDGDPLDSTSNALRGENVSGEVFFSGVYVSERDVARVVVVTPHGRVSGTVIKLAGKPGWGAWYADGGKPVEPTLIKGRTTCDHGFDYTFSVYDTAGKIISQFQKNMRCT